MHNCETHLLRSCTFFGNSYYILFLILTYFHTPTPPSNGRQDEAATSRAAARPLLESCHVIYFLFYYFPLPSRHPRHLSCRLHRHLSSAGAANSLPQSSYPPLVFLNQSPPVAQLASACPPSYQNSTPNVYG